MTPDPYTQLAHHLHALGMGYPLKDDLVDILRANFSPAGAEVALAFLRNGTEAASSCPDSTNFKFFRNAT